MASEPPSRHQLDKAGLAVGLCMFLAGAVGLVGLILTLYDTSKLAWEIGYHLGLPGTLLASAVTQLLILVGGWMVWRSLPR